MAKHNMPTNNINTAHTETKAPAEKVGTVVNCDKLNIRVKPNKEARILTVMEEGTSLTINPVRSTHNWYSVKLDSGLYGYCMREYVNVD